LAARCEFVLADMYDCVFISSRVRSQRGAQFDETVRAAGFPFASVRPEHHRRIEAHLQPFWRPGPDVRNLTARLLHAVSLGLTHALSADKSGAMLKSSLAALTMFTSSARPTNASRIQPASGIISASPPSGTRFR
jgi:hypothetical protein